MIRFSQYLPVNTGQLVALRRTGKALHLTVVEPNAASHVLPSYPLSEEAPRIYGEYTYRDVHRAWVMWAAELMGFQPVYFGPNAEKQARQYIEENIDKIPQV